MLIILYSHAIIVCTSPAYQDPLSHEIDPLTSHSSPRKEMLSVPTEVPNTSHNQEGELVNVHLQYSNAEL